MNGNDIDSSKQPSAFQKLSSALFFGLASFFITVVNKTVLTTFNFPSFLFLGLGQLVASVIILFAGKIVKLIDFPDITMNTFHMVFPLPVLFLGNMIFGLGGTQSLSLPMFTALRRISIWVTMILEIRLLGLKPGWMVQASVFSMIAGALLAASDDLSFHLEGYIYVMISNVLTALYQVYIKKKLDSDGMGKYGLMFYNSLLSLVPAILVNLASGDFEKAINFDKWHDPLFLSQFLLSCVMGFVLTFSTILCTLYNSALTTAMVGSIKNILVTYVGMFVGGDYIFSLINCMGLNVSVVGSLLYSYATFTRTTKKPESSESSLEKEDEEKATEKAPLLPDDSKV